MKATPLFAFFVLLAYVLSGCEPSGNPFSYFHYSQGKSDARAELARGVLAVESYGQPAAWAQHYRGLLKDKYGIEHREVAGCRVTDKITAHARGFNEVMRAAIDAKHGKDLLERVARQAAEEYQAQSTKLPPSVERLLGGPNLARQIAATKTMALCVRPFEGDAEEQELANTRESDAVHLTTEEVVRIRTALLDEKNYRFNVGIDCWRYNYARLKVDDALNIDFCPLCGMISVKKQGEVVGSGVFDPGVAMLDELLFRSFADDKIIATWRPLIERHRQRP